MVIGDPTPTKGSFDRLRSHDSQVENRCFRKFPGGESTGTKSTARDESPAVKLKRIPRKFISHRRHQLRPQYNIQEGTYGTVTGCI